MSQAARRLRSSYRATLEESARSLVPRGSRVLHLGCGDGSLLAALEPERGIGVDASEDAITRARSNHPRLEFIRADVEGSLNQLHGHGAFDYIVVGDALGGLHDAWSFLRGLHRHIGPDGQLVLMYFNFLWEPVLKAAEAVHLRDPVGEQNWLPPQNVVNLLELSGFVAVASGYGDPIPLGPPALIRPLNRVLSHSPLTRRLGINSYTVARPAPARAAAPSALTCTVVIPARNERGNIRPAIARMPSLGSHLEIVFVEGHSRDGTADEIRAVIDENPALDIKLVAQGKAKGKGDAMRKGLATARGDVLIILDADLTVAPEELPKFWCALLEGQGEFINGTRMVYPMEDEAMRLANLAANRVFGLAFSWILRQRVTDTLCGTKALYAADYRRIAENRRLFGDFDPFGDFDLLFGAAHLGLRIREVPIRYRRRSYGATQISRWRHGVLLLGMTVRGARMLRFTPRRRADTSPRPLPSTPAETTEMEVVGMGSLPARR